VPSTVVPTGAPATPDQIASAWSEPSLPAGARAPGTPATPVATWDGSAMAIVVDGLTHAHPLGAPWTAVAGDDRQILGEGSDHGPRLTIPLLAAGPPNATWQVALTSPDGFAAGVLTLGP
jgi:hypothetical protein